MANDMTIISFDEFMICLYIIQCYHFLEDWSYVSRFSYLSLLVLENMIKIEKNDQG